MDHSEADDVAKQETFHNESKKIVTLDLILKKNVPSSYKVGSDQCDVVQSVLSLKRVWLDNLLITNIDNLEMLGNVTHLYLQDNNITNIENLETIGTTLLHLNLKNNLIAELGDTLICLDKLMSLDISSNRIESILYRQLPQKLTFLNVASNPCMENGCFDKNSVVQNLINLKMIDNEELLSDEEDDDEDEDEEDNLDEEKKDEGVESEMSVMYEKFLADSKNRQNNFDDDHKIRLETLQQIRNNMETHSVRESVELVRSSLDNMELGGAISSLSRESPDVKTPLMSTELRRGGTSPELRRGGTLPPLDRPPSSKKTIPQKLERKMSQPRLNSPKQPRPLSSTDISLRQPLDKALVSCDDFDNFVKNVNGMFDGIKTDMNKLR